MRCASPRAIPRLTTRSTVTSRRCARWPIRSRRQPPRSPRSSQPTSPQRNNNMTAKDVNVGLTYEVLVSDKLVPVTLTSECQWGGGWYGKNNATGHTVRIKTAGRLRKQLDGDLVRQQE